MDHRIDMTAVRVFIKMASAAFRAKTKIVASNDARTLAWKSIVYYFSLELREFFLVT